MAARSSKRPVRSQGSIDELPSGALRVRVYAGVDPVTKARHYLTEIIPPGPKAYREAEATRRRLITDVEQRRNPRTNTTVDELLIRYLEQFDGAPNTLTLYRGYIRNHISPLLGRLKVGALDADILDSFYAELRRCRKHCDRRPFVEHRVEGEHECTDACREHECRPLNPSTVRHMHFILSGAYRKAVRWRWVSVSPINQAEPPSAPKPNPQPPTPRDAARILNEAWRDPDWGALVWTAMTTGARRGELAALREDDLDLTEGRETLWLRRAIRKDDNGELVEAELKTHQQRRIALDPESAEVMREHMARWEARLHALGKQVRRRLYLFSIAPDGSTWPRPDAITRRYERMADRLEIETTFHKLRHYSATELIAAGVDIRTVAGRLGHSGGGVTTLRTYTAWVSEADQRAATNLGSGMPARPNEHDATERELDRPIAPYELIAAELRDRILSGEIAEGQRLPFDKELCARYGVSVSTTRRAAGLLREWGFASDIGRRALMPASPEKPDEVAVPEAHVLAMPEGRELAEVPSADGVFWSVVLRGPGGRRYAPRLVRGDLAAPDTFRSHLIGIARVECDELTGLDSDWIAQFELEVHATAPDETNGVVLRWDR